MHELKIKTALEPSGEIKSIRILHVLLSSTETKTSQETLCMLLKITCNL